MKMINTINNYIDNHPEYKPMLYDILRLLTIQFISQLLFSMNNSQNEFLSKRFLCTILYLIVGVLVFWLIIYKTIISYNIRPLEL